MASQGGRVPGVVGMCDNLDSMAQDGDPEQDIGVEEQELPQTDPEHEMGAAAAAEHDTPYPSPVKIPSQSPADPRLRARRLPQIHLTWAK